MPIYEYHCRKCDSDFEVLVRNAADQPACTMCQSRDVEKQLSVPAAHVASASSLPVCGPRPSPGGGCGLPQCGMGSCQFDE